MLYLSSNWYFTFHEWISSHYTLDHQYLQNLNHYLTLLQELHRKNCEFNTEFYNSIQGHIDEITKSNQDSKTFFENGYQSNDQIIEYEDAQFNELLKFVLIEIKDQAEIGKDEVREFKDTSSSESTSNHSTSTFSTKASLTQFYPKKVFEYLNDYEDDLYKLILKKQLEIIYGIDDISRNIESLKNLLTRDDPFPRKNALLFIIIIYSTCKLLGKLEKLDTIIEKNLINDLRICIGNFMKRIDCITLDLVNRDDSMDKINLFKFSLYSVVIIFFQLYFFSLFLNVCVAY